MSEVLRLLKPLAVNGEIIVHTTEEEGFNQVVRIVVYENSYKVHKFTELYDITKSLSEFLATTPFVDVTMEQNLMVLLALSVDAQKFASKVA